MQGNIDIQETAMDNMKDGCTRDESNEVSSEEYKLKKLQFTGQAAQ